MTTEKTLLFVTANSDAVVGVEAHRVSHNVARRLAGEKFHFPFKGQRLVMGITCHTDVDAFNKKRSLIRTHSVNNQKQFHDLILGLILGGKL